MHSLSILRLSRLLTISVLSFVLMGCFGEGDDSDPIVGVASGKLVFSDAEGVTFKSASQEGVTGPNSAFSYFPGETVTFAIGDIETGIILGSVKGKPFITAVDLTGSSDLSDPRAAGLLAFVESFRVAPGKVKFDNTAIQNAGTYHGLDFSDATQRDLAIAGLGGTPISAALARDNFCLDTYLPRGGESVFGFPFPECSESPAKELLQNRSFEEDVSYEFYVDPVLGFPEGNRGFFPTGWRDGFNQFYDEGNLYTDIDGVVKSTYPANTGDKSLRLAGPDFFNSAYPEPDANIVDQEFVPVAGEPYTASIWVLNDRGSLYSPNLFNLVLVFSCDGVFDDGLCDYEFTKTGTPSAEVALAGDQVYLAPDVWTKMTVTATAPLDTIAARLRIAHVQFPRSPADTATPGNISRRDLSAVFVDDASLIGPTVEEPPVVYQEVWFDDFDDLTNWTPETGYGPNNDGWGNQEWQNYTTDTRNLSVGIEDGLSVLNITAHCDYLESPGQLAGTPPNTLLNPTFSVPEATPGQVPTGGGCTEATIGPGWITGGNLCNVVRASDDRSQALKQQTPWPHDNVSTGQTLKQFLDSSVYQDVDAEPGKVVKASVWAQSWDGATATIGLPNASEVPFAHKARLQLLFLDSLGVQIGAVIEEVITPADLPAQNGETASDWTRFEVEAIAPANTATARIQLVHELDGPFSAAPIWWDDASLTVAETDCNIGGPQGRNGSITSAKINTLTTMPPIRYGKIEGRIKVPVGKGAWPAFWMLGTSHLNPTSWPQAGEIDIMEVFTVFGNNNRTTHGTLHWCDEVRSAAEANGNPDCPWVPALNRNAGKDPSGDTGSKTLSVSLGDDYHVYSIEWNARRILFKIDGEQFHRVVIDPVLMEEFNKDFYLILNLAMGGTLGSEQQPPAANASNWVMPQTMLVDWVRVSTEVAP